MPSSKYFNSVEWTCHCGCGEGDDIISQTLLNLLDQLRENVGGPLTANCMYRCPSHNASIGGAKASQHVLGTAADIATPAWLTTGEFKWYVENCRFNGTKFTGIGVYAYDTSCNTKGDGFIHVDVRRGGDESDSVDYWEDLG